MTRLDLLAFLKNHKDPSEKFVIKVPSENRYIRKVSARILSWLEPYKLDENRLFDIRLCIEEAVRNAIVHGNHSDKRRSVKASYWIDSDSLNIEVEDEGEGFNHREVADPTTAQHIMKTSGRGVYLIKKLMDRVRYSEKGNSVTMTKRLK